MTFLSVTDMIRFERVLPGPLERVWEYLTVPELHFLQSSLSAHFEPPPARFKQFENGCSLEGRVTRCEPPRLLSYTWGGDGEVSFELTPRGEDVRLVLIHRRLEPKHLVGVASGWHTHLGILGDRLRGVEPSGFWSTHARMEAEYTARLAQG